MQYFRYIPQAYSAYRVGAAAKGYFGGTGYRLGSKSTRPYKRRGYKRGFYKKVPASFKKNLLNLKDTKYLNDLHTTAAPVGATSDVQTINLISQGDSDSARDGSDIYLMSFSLKGQLKIPIAATKASDTKLMLVQKYDTRGSQLTMNELYDSDSLYENRNLDNSKNFRILKTMRWHMAPMTTTNDQQIKSVFFYYKFKKPIRVKYDGVSNTDADIDRNGLYLVWVTNAVVADAPTFTSGHSRLAFKDI